VAIMLTSNGVAPALSHLSTQLLGIHRSVAQIGTGFNRWRVGLVGAASVMGGSMVLGALGKIAAHGEQFLDQQARLKVLGLSNQQVAEAIRIKRDGKASRHLTAVQLRRREK
jgi:hypothetical protein